ncbi:hypothetical protein, partial [Salmonella enterica]|uniref:hypothetical protein n=1 Tax=Salmonella enterica TaxID=28901 RepID=UPI001CB75D73
FAHFYVALIIHNILLIHAVMGFSPLYDTNCNSAQGTQPVLFYLFSDICLLCEFSVFGIFFSSGGYTMFSVITRPAALDGLIGLR